MAVGLPIQNVPYPNQRASSNQLSPTVTVPRERNCSDINLSPTYGHQRPARNARVGHLCFLLKPYKFMARLLRNYNTSPITIQPVVLNDVCVHAWPKRYTRRVYRLPTTYEYLVYGKIKTCLIRCTIASLYFDVNERCHAHVFIFTSSIPLPYRG
jgi:hypothetical protein